MRRILGLVALLALAACAGGPGPRTAEDGAVEKGGAVSLPPMKLFGPVRPDPPGRSNGEIAQDFLDLSFELESGRELPVFTRFEGPLTLRMTGAVPPTARHDVGALLARLRSEAGIAIAATGAADAGITVEFLPRRQLQARAPEAACFVAPRIGSWADYVRARRATIDWAQVGRRDRVAIFIPSDVAPQEIRDCLHEELAQSLGPLNDLYRLPDSVFNDDNIHTILTGFDMLILRATFAPELTPGMTRGEVAQRLPRILARLNPRGEFPGWPTVETPRAYVDAVARALGPNTSRGGRLNAAATAVEISQPWLDHRTGFAWLTLGRLAGQSDPGGALVAIEAADAIFRAQGLPLHAAVADLQIAGFALAAGDFGSAVQIADRALRPATAAQNASLMAGLLLIKAEALDHLGRRDEAARVRLDSLGWARYGMESDAEVRHRLAAVAAIGAQSIEHPQ